MYPSKFTRLKAETVSDAVSHLEENPDAELLAGGQSLIPLQKMRFATPETVIDLNNITNLEHITETDDEIKVGAMARHTAIEQHASVQKHIYLFSECISQIADWQVRNQGTMGGTVAEADPSGDYFPPLKLLNPDIVITGPDSERMTSFDDFYLGMFTVDLEHAELITEVRLPKLVPAEGAVSVGSTYQKHAERSGDYAIVGEAAIVHIDESEEIIEAKLSVGAVGSLFRAEEAEQAVLGTKLSEEILEEAAAAVQAEATPDVGGREGEYKKEMSGVFAKRTLQTAYERAREQL